MGLWSWPWGRPGPSGFGGESTAEEVTAGIDASHLTAIVTVCWIIFLRTIGSAPRCKLFTRLQVPVRREEQVHIHSPLPGAWPCGQGAAAVFARFVLCICWAGSPRHSSVFPGATNGIGKETARVLAMQGAEVIIPARTIESGLKVKENLADEVPGSKLHVIEMDLSSLSSVRSFAESFNSSHACLNILINNAGIMACPFQLSKDGIELQFATNHLGHFLLTNLLLDKMRETARETGVQGRIVNVSSVAHKRSDGSCFDLKKLNDRDRYNPFIAYSHSKLANILHANELSRRFQEEGCNLTANSPHPGVIATNIVRYVLTNKVLVSVLSSVAKPFLRGIPQGAATTCYLALHPDLKDVSGKYFAACNEATPTPVARDAELAKRLWSLSEELCRGHRGEET